MPQEHARGGTVLMLMEVMDFVKARQSNGERIKTYQVPRLSRLWCVHKNDGGKDGRARRRQDYRGSRDNVLCVGENGMFLGLESVITAPGRQSLEQSPF